ncbi:MAG: RsmD family RNA methyltransferase [Phycisphaerales bacterium]|nr:RsmD family RNA methyltransferase [Phycisphaerales bacterium]
MLRITGGEFRSRTLRTPRGDDVTRPWSALAREGICNLLRGHLPGGRVLDLFAGVGTIGLEAASRGAASVVMVERDRRIFALLQENIETLGCGDRVSAIEADALGTVAMLRGGKDLDVIFIDPPYASMQEDVGRDRIMQHLPRLSECLTEDGFLVLRTPLDPGKSPHTVDGLAGPEVHQYGRGMWVLLYALERTEAS